MTLDEIGKLYYEHRMKMCLSLQHGLTDFYNRFHSPDDKTEDILTIRKLHVAMDEAVKIAYGWVDLQLEHGFQDTKQGLRFTISEEARREVLDRLLALNHERYKEEVKQGLHDKGVKGSKKKAAKGKKAKADDKQMSF